MRRIRAALAAVRVAPAAALLVLAAACAPAVPPPEVPAPAPPCAIAGPAPERLSIAVSALPDPRHAPVASTAAGRLAFRQLYETLVFVDCEGRVVPGLAEQWSAEEQGTAWRFRLRANAAFADGSAVTPLAVVRAWSASALAAPRAAALLAQVDVTGARELRVTLREAVASPALFAASAFAVTRHDTASTWPAGTGPYHVVAEDPLTLSLAPRFAGLPRLELVQAPRDGRSALDAGLDVLLTADAATLDYARALPDVTITPLGWSHTYVLAARGASAPPADTLAALARNAVRADARASTASPCLGATAPRAATGRLAGSLAYPRDDAVARAIAERLVALAWPASVAPPWLRALLGTYTAAPSAVGLDDGAIAGAVRDAAALGVVLPLTRLTGSACLDLATATTPAADALAASGLHVLPLVDVREHAVQRTAPGGAVIDGDGVLRFTTRGP